MLVCCFSKHMYATFFRYEKLTQYLHVNTEAARVPHNNPDYHPLNKVLPLANMANANFSKMYQHHCEVSIDEAMKRYKGRTELRMYMPLKPDKFGIKFWARCDGKTSYMSKFELYSGKRDRTEVQKKHGLGYRVIHDLTRDLVGLYHCIYFVRFFTCVSLLEHLLDDDIYACGTMMTNRKRSPPQLNVSKRATKLLIPSRGDSVSYQNDKGVTVTAWNDNNVVVVGHTNLSVPSATTKCTRRVGKEKKEVDQPAAIEAYNQCMNGVDLHDQMRKKYGAGRNSKKYWKYIMWFILDCCRVNAWIMYKETHPDMGRTYTQKHFVIDIGKSLIGNFSSRKQISISEHQENVQPIAQQIEHKWIRLEGKKNGAKGVQSKNDD